jgi:translation initiation factor 3 subunit H
LPSTVTGQIQGVDNDGVLQITHSFPFTASAGADEVDVGEIDYDDMDGSQYQVSMLKRLRQMNYDVNTCGWYRTADPALFEPGVVEDQYTYQKTFPHSVVLVYDPARQGNLALVAYRLTPKFMQMRGDSSTGRFSMEGLLANKLTFSKVFQPVPVKIHNTSFASALIQQLMFDTTKPDVAGMSMPSPTFASLLEETTALSPNFDNLELNFDNYLESRLENMIQEVG